MEFDTRIAFWEYLDESGTASVDLWGGSMQEKGNAGPFEDIGWLRRGYEPGRCIASLGARGICSLMAAVSGWDAPVDIFLDRKPLGVYGDPWTEFDDWLESFRTVLETEDAPKMLILKYPSLRALAEVNWPRDFGAFEYDMVIRMTPECRVTGWGGEFQNCTIHGVSQSPEAMLAAVARACGYRLYRYLGSTRDELESEWIVEFPEDQYQLVVG